MTTRRDLMFLTLGGVVGLTALPGRVLAESAASVDDVSEALDAWLDAVYSGDTAVLERVLAPEFQILRSNGVGHDRNSYLGGGLPQQTMRSRPSDTTATAHEAILVVRYNLETEQIIDGVAVSGSSPRLSVFRKENGRWLVVAHANFAPLN